jgi:hypothetical protein
MPYPKRFEVTYTDADTGETEGPGDLGQQSVLLMRVQRLKIGDTIMIKRTG